MPLSVNTPIAAGDIMHVKELKGLKVFLLMGANHDNLVVKGELLTAVQYKSASPAIKAIDPRAKAKILTQSERFALSSFISDFEYLRQQYSDMGLAYGTDEEAAAVASLKQNLTWAGEKIKMEAHKLTNLESAFEQRMGGNKASLKAFTEALTAAGGLERLGKVIAADLFNDNKDRFDPNGGGSKDNMGGRSFNWKALVNPGNVFLSVNGGAQEISGLDHVEPFSKFKDINVALATAELSADYKWPGRVLGDAKKRSEYAEKIVSDLEGLLSPKKHKLSLMTKLGRDASKRLEKGMVQGAQLIKVKLEQKYNGPPSKWTPGVVDRYKIISEAR